MGIEVYEVASTGVAAEITKIAASLTGTIADVAPIAIGIVGSVLVWKFGVKFFKGLKG